MTFSELRAFLNKCALKEFTVPYFANIYIVNTKFGGLKHKFELLIGTINNKAACNFVKMANVLLIKIKQVIYVN